MKPVRFNIKECEERTAGSVLVILEAVWEESDIQVPEMVVITMPKAVYSALPDGGFELRFVATNGILLPDGEIKNFSTPTATKPAAKKKAAPKKKPAPKKPVATRRPEPIIVVQQEIRRVEAPPVPGAGMSFLPPVPGAPPIAMNIAPPSGS